MIPIICHNVCLNTIAKQIRCISSYTIYSNQKLLPYKNVKTLKSSQDFNVSSSLLNTYRSLNVTPVRQISLTPARMSAADHSKLWTIERALAISLLASLPVALAVPNPALDTIAAISIVMHQYWGIEATLTDYVRPIIFGSVIPKIAHGLLVALTLATLGGLFYFNYNDIGISRAIRRLWTLGANKNKE